MYEVGLLLKCIHFMILSIWNFVSLVIFIRCYSQSAARVAIKILCYITELNFCPHLVSQILGYWNVKEAIKEGWADVADGIHGFCFNRADIYVTKRRQKMEGISENVNKWQISSFPCIFWFSFNFIFSLNFIRDD